MLRSVDRRFGTTDLQGSRRDCLTLEDGTNTLSRNGFGCLAPEYDTDRLSRNVDNYEYMLRNIPEERRSDLYRGGSLKFTHDCGSLVEAE